jgi:transposase
MAECIRPVCASGSQGRYGYENSRDDAAMRLKLWLNRAFALARDIAQLAASTIRTEQRKLEKDIDAILRTPTACALSADLIGQFARARDQLLTFWKYPGEVEASNNDCERDLRPSVVQRKVTNGHRASWPRTMRPPCAPLDTARLAGAGPFQTIRNLQRIAAAPSRNRKRQNHSVPATAKRRRADAQICAQ